MKNRPSLSSRKPRKSPKAPSRRDFLTSSAAAAATFTIVPSSVLAQNGHTAPGNKLNIAAIGAGGIARHNLNQCRDENIVALADVDQKQAARTYEALPDAARYVDFRDMLEKEDKNIDAVLIATPDHVHAVAAVAAMQMGKHVYVQKPLSRTVSEARRLQEVAREKKVITQMGNQGHSGEGIRLICEWIWAGAIGQVREVHAWTNRPVWPQGIVRPSEALPVPDTLDWDLWLGPSPYRDYHPIYAPFNWRGWWDFGTGALGDMACHILDPVFWALKLGSPVRVEAHSSPCISANQYDRGSFFADCDDCCPLSSLVRFEYPARGDMSPVKLTWYDGGLMPERPRELEPGRRMGDSDGGVLFVGDKGKLMCGCYARGPRLIPDSAMRAFNRPGKTLARVPGGQDGHEKDWIAACKEGRQPSSNFDVSVPLTEGILLGCAAIRYGKPLEWDGDTMTVTNEPDANALIHHDYRRGWSI